MDAVAPEQVLMPQSRWSRRGFVEPHSRLVQAERGRLTAPLPTDAALPRYDEAAAKEAWQRTLDWFNKYLRAGAA